MALGQMASKVSTLEGWDADLPRIGRGLGCETGYQVWDWLPWCAQSQHSRGWGDCGAGRCKATTERLTVQASHPKVWVYLCRPSLPHCDPAIPKKQLTVRNKGSSYVSWWAAQTGRGIKARTRVRNDEQRSQCNLVPLVTNSSTATSHDYADDTDSWLLAAWAVFCVY